MKTLLIILSMCGLKIEQPKKYLTRTERSFVKNVVKIYGEKPQEIYKLTNNKIQLNYSDQRITLGEDGFIHELAILHNNEWIDLGPEY